MIGYTANDFVREDAKLATITVSFASSVDERVYQVTRRCGRRTEYLIFDPDLQQKICEGKADVLTFLRRHMGVEDGADLSGLFRDAVGVPQGTFTAAFLQTASQRKGIFDPLLQVEEYRTAAERLNEPRRVLRDRQAQLDVQISAVEARLERLPQLEAECKTRSTDIEESRKELTRNEQELAVVSSQRSQLDALRQQVSTAENRRAQAAQQLTTLNSQAENANKTLQQAQMARQIVAENQAAHDRYVQAQQEQQRLEEQSRQRQQLLSQQATADKALALAQSEIKTQRTRLEEIAQAESLIASLQSVVEHQSNLEKELAELQQQRTRLADAQQANQRQSQELKRLQDRQEALKTQLVRAESLRQQQVMLDQEITTTQQRIDEGRDRLAGFKAEADALKSQSETLGQTTTALCPVCEQLLSEVHRKKLLERNEQRVTTLRAQYSSENNGIKNGESAIKELRQRVQQTSDELLRLPRADESTELAQRIAQMQDELMRVQAQIQQLEKAPAQILALEKQLAQLDNPRQRSQIAAAQANQRSTIEQKLKKAEATKEEVDGQLAALQKELAAFASLDQAIADITQALRAGINGYQQVLSNRRLAETVEEHAESVTRLNELIVSAQSEAAEREREFATIAAQFDPQKLQQMQTTEQLLRNHSASLQTRLKMLVDAQQRAEQEIASLRQQQEQVVALQQKRQQFTEQEQLLETMRSSLRQAGPHITRALIGQISNNASQIFGDLMQDYSRQLQWNEDYSITLEVDGRQRQFSQLSGGEQMSAALSVRLALLREMSNIDVAFFDEPTTNLDDARRESLARQILDVRGFRQLFVISHDDTFEQATQNVIRVKRVDGHSEIQS